MRFGLIRHSAISRRSNSRRSACRHQPKIQRPSSNNSRSDKCRQVIPTNVTDNLVAHPSAQSQQTQSGYVTLSIPMAGTPTGWWGTSSSWRYSELVCTPSNANSNFPVTIIDYYVTENGTRQVGQIYRASACPLRANVGETGTRSEFTGVTPQGETGMTHGIRDVLTGRGAGDRSVVQADAAEVFCRIQAQDFEGGSGLHRARRNRCAPSARRTVLLPSDCVA